MWIPIARQEGLNAAEEGRKRGGGRDVNDVSCLVADHESVTNVDVGKKTRDERDAKKLIPCANETSNPE